MITQLQFKLPDHSRVWIYQASRFLSDQEIRHINEQAGLFLHDWNTHGTALSAEIQLFHNLFMVIVVDEEVAKASGCSIDKSVRLVKSLESDLSISFTGRTNLAYWQGEHIQAMHFADFRKKMDAGEFSGETIVFNNLVSTLGDLKHHWQIPAKDSWLTQVPV